MSAGLDEAIQNFRIRVTEMEARAQEFIAGLGDGLELTLQADQAEHLASIIERMSEMFAGNAARMAELEDMQRRGRYDEGRQLIELTTLMMRNQLEILGRTSEFNGVTSEEENPGDYRTPEDGMNIQGTCNHGECGLYSQEIYAPLRFGRFDIGTKFRDYRCPSCNGELVKLTEIVFSNCSLHEESYETRPKRKLYFAFRVPFTPIPFPLWELK